LGREEKENTYIINLRLQGLPTLKGGMEKDKFIKVERILRRKVVVFRMPARSEN
jgi:hypothetical protein